jgi:hypothetical protein
MKEEIVDDYDIVTLNITLSEIYSFLRDYEEGKYTNDIWDIYEDKFRDLDWHASKSTNINNIGYDLMKIGDMCDKDITENELKYLRDVYDKLEIYLKDFSAYTDKSIIEKAFDFSRKKRIKELENIFYIPWEGLN